MKIPRGCASYDCSCTESHSVPVETTGKCSSVVVKLLPAPQGTGLVVNDEMKKILKEIQTGKFAKEWMTEVKSGGKKFKANQLT